MGMLYNETCQTELSYFLTFKKEYLLGLQVISIITFLLNLLTTITVTFLIIHTKQLTNTSVLIIFYFNLCNVGLTVANGLLVILYHQQKNGCIFEFLVLFFTVAYMQAAAYMVVIIAYDRYSKVIHLHQYDQKMRRVKVNSMTLSMHIIAYCQGIMHVAVYFINHSKAFIIMAQIFRLTTNAVMVVSCVAFYTKAILAVKRIRRNSNNPQLLKQVEGVVTKLSTFYLLSVIVLYMPAFTADLVRQIAQESTIMHYLYLISSLLVLTNPALNAVMFLILNRPVHQFIYTAWLEKKCCFRRRHRKVGNISPNEKRKMSLTKQTKTMENVLVNEMGESSSRQQNKLHQSSISFKHENDLPSAK